MDARVFGVAVALFMASLSSAATAAGMDEQGGHPRARVRQRIPTLVRGPAFAQWAGRRWHSETTAEAGQPGTARAIDLGVHPWLQQIVRRAAGVEWRGGADEDGLQPVRGNERLRYEDWRQ